MRKQLEKVLNSYLNEIYKIFTSGNFSEGSFYPILKELIDAWTKSKESCAGVICLPKKTETGIIPDFLIRKKGAIIGYIEAKAPETNLDSIEDTEQLKRYRESLPNLILTNFLEFRLYRNNQRIAKTAIGRQFTLKDLKCVPTAENIDAFVELLENFFSFSLPEIRTSAQLSEELAKKTRYLKYILLEELKRENGEIIKFYQAFREELLETLTKERFADLYAQTITYGLFSARMTTRNNFTKEAAWRSIPESLPLLREIFHSFTGPNFPESLSWAVDEIFQILQKADVNFVLKEFKTTKWEDDPVIHFYETFLSVYNPEERERLGVYYTPLPVVSYIVRSINEILKKEFHKEEGLATKEITLLDPAAGTLTFVVQAIKQVEKELKERRKEGLLRSYIEEHILKNFYAFEILVAPYTIGHFKVAMVFEEMGYKLPKDKRFQFYLTNTLEMKEPKKLTILTTLTKEGEEAKRIKERVPILVIFGNPPYSFKSVKAEFIDELMKDYKEDVKGERKYGVLEDDYIKFIRFAHWKIEQAGRGILGFITNNSYLSGIIHRGMRRKLLETFDEIYILNLHGSSRIGEKRPDGGKDENVFDIQQGVVIALYTKLPEPKKEKKVFYADLWGLREEKYKYLFKNNVKSTKWQRLKPVAPYYFLVPKDFALQEEYGKFWKVTDIFLEWGSGVITRRDILAIAFDETELRNRMLMFANPKFDDSIIAETFKINLESGEWKSGEDDKYALLRAIRQEVEKEDVRMNIKKYHYRVWDFRYIYYSDAVISRTCRKWMEHLLEKGENISLITCRQVPTGNWRHAFVSQLMGDMGCISNRISENSYFFPLYLFKEKENSKRRTSGSVSFLFEPHANYQAKESNLSPIIVEQLSKILGKEPTPEEIFCYIYAILYSPTYRQKYEEFLKIDFPRIPPPKDYKSFKRLSKIGQELVDLHLLKHQSLQKTKVGFPKSGSNKVERVHYDLEKKRVFINKEQFFVGIEKEVYEYKIGAYQVLEKYLKDRKGRKLSLEEINHYLKVTKAIELTIDLQEKLEKIWQK